MRMLCLPAKVGGQRGERHVVQSENGQVLELDEAGRQARNGIATEVSHLQRLYVLDRLRNVRYVCPAYENSQRSVSHSARCWLTNNRDVVNGTRASKLTLRVKHIVRQFRRYDRHLASGLS